MIGERTQDRQKMLDLSHRCTRDNVFETIERLNHLHDKCHIQILSALESSLREDRSMPSVSFSFVEMGSGGRMERTLWSDQDNALVYQCEAIDRERVQPLLKTFADETIQSLYQAGYPLCPGWVMANNPRWLKTIEEWKQNWHHWSQTPNSEAIRYLLLSVDARTVYGDPEPIIELKRWLIKRIQSSGWIAHLAAHVMNYPLPMGWFGQLFTTQHGEFSGRFNIKEGGYYQIVSIIRLLSLDAGIADCSTRGRLNALYQNGYFSQSLRNSWEDCLAFFLFARLRQHRECDRQIAPIHDFADLASWSGEEIRELKNHLGFIRNQQKYWKKALGKEGGVSGD